MPIVILTPEAQKSLDGRSSLKDRRTPAQIQVALERCVANSPVIDVLLVTHHTEECKQIESAFRQKHRMVIVLNTFDVGNSLSIISKNDKNDRFPGLEKEVVLAFLRYVAGQNIFTTQALTYGIINDEYQVLPWTKGPAFLWLTFDSKLWPGLEERHVFSRTAFTFHDLDRFLRGPGGQVGRTQSQFTKKALLHILGLIGWVFSEQRFWFLVPDDLSEPVGYYPDSRNPSFTLLNAITAWVIQFGVYGDPFTQRLLRVTSPHHKPYRDHPEPTILDMLKILIGEQPDKLRPFVSELMHFKLWVESVCIQFWYDAKHHE